MRLSYCWVSLWHITNSSSVRHFSHTLCFGVVTGDDDDPGELVLSVVLKTDLSGG